MRLPERVAVVLNHPDESNVALGEEAVRDIVGAAEAVQAALREGGCRTSMFGCGRSPDQLLGRLREAAPEVVFNLAEEAWGSDRFEPAVAYLLEVLGIPFTGSGPEALALARDKARARALVVAAGGLVPEADLYLGPSEPAITRPWPILVKPACRDASIGIHAGSVVGAGKDPRAALDTCAAQGGWPVLAERFLDGRELNVTLLEREPDAWTVIPSEIDYGDLPAGIPRILSYAAKWSDGSIEEVCTKVRPGVELEADLQEQVDRTARGIVRWFGLRGYARFDARVDEQGKLRVIDVNPNPDISPGAGVSRAVARRGIELGDFVRGQAALAWARARAAAP